MPTLAEIERARTANGGWTRKQLREWGVPWPPPKGWKQDLVRKSDMERWRKKYGREQQKREQQPVEHDQSMTLEYLLNVGL